MNANLKEEILDAVARGWCSENNAHKELDAELAATISAEVEVLVQSVIVDCMKCVTLVGSTNLYSTPAMDIAHAINNRITAKFGVVQ